VRVRFISIRVIEAMRVQGASGSARYLAVPPLGIDNQCGRRLRVLGASGAGNVKIVQNHWR
jgi:hypothetical protein